ncbi:MAG TPA: phospholipase [Micromonosporaceae bacterium]|nr:phospholipase [Micromonosporaceae bacterium]
MTDTPQDADTANTGALVIITGPEWKGRAIEISRRDSTARRQVPVLQRRGPGTPLFSAVFPELPAGPYVIWRDTAESAGTVMVAAATVTELEWWSPPPAEAA